MKNNITELLEDNAILVSPSILAADFANLGAEILSIEKAGAELIHIDVMDGHFVPNISIGIPVVKSVRSVTDLPLDVHLMISEPLKYIQQFADAGADHITFHLESEGNTGDVIRKIKESGCTAGISIKPGTAADLIYPFLDDIDLVLIMSVEPGFGGQSFMPETMEKVKKIRGWINDAKLPVHLEVDGGIDGTTVKTAAGSGANMMVAGTFVFKHPEGTACAISSLKMH